MIEPGRGISPIVLLHLYIPVSVRVILFIPRPSLRPRFHRTSYSTCTRLRNRHQAAPGTIFMGRVSSAATSQEEGRKQEYGYVISPDLLHGVVEPVIAVPFVNMSLKCLRAILDTQCTYAFSPHRNGQSCYT